MAWGHFLTGAWPDVVATPTGIAIVRVLNQETVVCEQDGVELWRRTCTVGLRPKFLRAAVNSSTGEVRAIVAQAIAGNLDRAVVVSESAETNLGINTFAAYPVMLTFESGDFVAYICTSKFAYVRYPLSGSPSSAIANPFPATGTIRGMRDVIATVVQWDEDTVTPGQYATVTIGTTAFYHYRQSGTMTVGTQKGPPETPEGVVFSPDGVGVSSPITVRAFNPTMATGTAGIYIGKTVIVAHTATVNGNMNVAVFAGPPWPDLQTSTSTGLASLAAVYQHPVIDKSTGRMTEPWYRTLRDLFTRSTAPIDLGSARVVGMLDPENGGTGVNTGLDFLIDQLGAITDLTGDVTASGPGSVPATIANDAVTYAKMQNVSAASMLLGRGSAAGAGDVEEITLGTNLSMSGTTLNAASTATGFARTFLLMGG